MYRRCVLLARDTVKRAIVSLSFETSLADKKRRRGREARTLQRIVMGFVVVDPSASALPPSPLPPLNPPSESEGRCDNKPPSHLLLPQLSPIPFLGPLETGECAHSRARQQEKNSGRAPRKSRRPVFHRVRSARAWRSRDEAASSTDIRNEDFRPR